jgi:hypothetical protein
MRTSRQWAIEHEVAAVKARIKYHHRKNSRPQFGKRMLQGAGLGPAPSSELGSFPSKGLNSESATDRISIVSPQSARKKLEKP